MLETILKDVLYGVSSLAIGAVIAYGNRALKVWLTRHSHDFIGKVARRAVRYIEMTELDKKGKAKFDAAMARILLKYPWLAPVKEELVEAVEEAVTELHESRPGSP